MWELDCEESWALKNWCFWTVVLEKTLESPLTARRSKQSILKEVSPGCSLEGTILKLKLQYFGHLMWRVDSLEKTLMLEGLGTGGEGDDRGWDGWMASLTQWTWVWVDCGSWWWTGRPGMLRFMGSQRVGHDWATELNWGYEKPIPVLLKLTVLKPNSNCHEGLYSVTWSLSFLLCNLIKISHHSPEEKYALDNSWAREDERNLWRVWT